MPHLSRSIPFRVLGALLMALGCSDPSAPRLVGSFVLLTVGGDSVPSPARLTATDTIFADTVRISFLGSGTNRLLAEHRQMVFRPAGRVLEAFAEVYVRDGNVLTYVPPVCPFNADCIYQPRTAVLDGNEFRITYTFAAYGYRETLFGKLD